MLKVYLAISVAFVVDALITIIGFGFYFPGVHFSLNTLLAKLWPDTFDIRQTAIDFLVISSIRWVIVAVGVILHVKQKKFKRFEHGRNLFSSLSMSYSLAKILTFAEIKGQLEYSGLWLNVIMNILLSFLLPKIQRKTISYIDNNANTYHRMEDGDVDDNPSTTSETSSTSDQEKNRKSTGAHTRDLLGYCKKHILWFCVGFFFLFIYSGARVFIPYYIGKVLADIMSESHGKESDLHHDILMLFVLASVGSIAAGFRAGSFSRTMALINIAMARDLFSSIVKQEIAFFDSNQTGAITSRLTSDCQVVASSISTNFNMFMRNSCMLIGSLIFMFQLSWKLTMITFIAIPPLIMFCKYYGLYCEELNEKAQTAMAEANRMAEEVIGSMRTVRAFACEEKERGRYKERLDKTMEFKTKEAVAFTGYVWVNEIGERLVLISVLIYAARLVIKGELDAAAVTSFFFYQVQLSENFSELSYVFSGLMESVGASRKVLEYIQREPEIKYDGQHEGVIKGEIHLDKVKFAYPSRPNNPVFEDLSIHISPGQTVALVGPSGAGKSSVISLLEHFYNASSGSIKLDGVPISDYSHSFYHQKVSLVSQEPILYSGSVRDNILYGCEGTVTEEDVIQAAKLSNAFNFITEMENGFDTLCGEKGVQMSGGQKQRIAIARALVRKPAVLILDEATSALDSESEYVIQQALQKCCVGRTVVVIAHRLSTVERADTIYVINKGKVVQEGNHRSLMMEDGLYKQLVQRQLFNGSNNE